MNEGTRDILISVYPFIAYPLKKKNMRLAPKKVPWEEVARRPTNQMPDRQAYAVYCLCLFLRINPLLRNPHTSPYPCSVAADFNIIPRIMIVEINGTFFSGSGSHSQLAIFRCKGIFILVNGATKISFFPIHFLPVNPFRTPLPTQ
jgi:hypothetical protein